LLRWQDGAWHDPQESSKGLMDYAQDPENNTISAVICQSGKYALFNPAYTMFFPVVP
jgi:hypothetical protein